MQTSGGGGSAPSKPPKKKDSSSLNLGGNLSNAGWDAQNALDFAASDKAGAAKRAAADKKSASNASHAMDVFGTFGNGVIHNTLAHLKNPSMSVGKGPDIVPPGYGQDAGLAATAGHSQMDAARLQALSQHPYVAPGDNTGDGGGGGASGYGWAPTALPSAANYKVDLSSLPTLSPTADLASFMAQAAKASHLGDVKQPYEAVKNQVTQDAGISEAQAKAMYAALQGQLSAGAGNIAGGYDAANANAAQSEQGLAAQVANTYGAGSSSANAQAQALGMGSLGGQVADNSLRASQGALGDLQSSLQASQAETNGDKAAALGANRDMGTAVGARSAQDVGNMAMAASDAKARVGVAEGAAYNQAAQASAALGGNLWSTALSNNLGAFNANIGLWGSKTNAGLAAASQAEKAWADQNGMGLQGAQLGESQRQFDLGYGLNQAQFGASVLGAKNSAIQAYLAQIQKAIGDQRLYGGTQPSSIAAELAAIQGGKTASPYSSILPNLNLGSAGAAQYGG